MFRASSRYASYVPRKFKHSDWVNCVAISPDSRKLLTATNDGHVSLWELSSPDVFKGPVKSHRGFPIQCVAFSPDGLIFASGGDDQSIRVWNSESFREIYRPMELKGPVKSIAFCPNPNRKQLSSITGCGGGKLQFWDLGTKVMKELFKHIERNTFNDI